MFSSSVEGLHAIVVTDRDGVPVVKGKERLVDPSFSISILGRSTVQTIPVLSHNNSTTVHHSKVLKNLNLNLLLSQRIEIQYNSWNCGK